MRILLLNRVLPPAKGASGRVLAELAAHLQAAGHTVDIITYAKDLPQRSLSYIIANLSLGLRALCARRAARIVIMTDPPLLVLWAPLLKLRHRGARIIYSCQDMYPDLLPYIGIRLPNWLLSCLQRWKNCALKAVDHSVVIGRCMAHELLARYPAVRGKTSLINNWAEQNLTPHMPPFDTFTVLYAGNMGPLHPWPAIIAAARLLQHDKIDFIIMGSGRNRHAVETAARDLPRVIFKPFLPDRDAHEIQGRAQLHLASLHENATGLLVPVKTMSALACHRPLIFLGDAAAEPARVLDDYAAGLTIAGQDGAALAAAIKTYAADSALWQAACDGAAAAHAALYPTLQLHKWLAALMDNA